MPNQLRPGWVRHNSAWQPKWTAKWTPLTDATFMQWLAFLILLALHKTACKSEFFSQHWLYHRQCVKLFFSCKEHEHIKAALHCQRNGEEDGLEAIDGKPQLKKIGILIDHIHNKCTLLYHPGADIAHYEISILMAGRCGLKKQLLFKPISEGI
eukprot:1686914-Rhodomonas_salina.1